MEHLLHDCAEVIFIELGERSRALFRGRLGGCHLGLGLVVGRVLSCFATRFEGRHVVGEDWQDARIDLAGITVVALIDRNSVSPFGG